MSGEVLYLRSEVDLVARVGGENVRTTMIPHRASWRDGGHKHADTAEVEIHGSVLPYPVENTSAVFMALYQGVAPSPYESIASPDTLRFCGYVDEEEVDHDHRVVRLKARDLSAPLRDHKSLVPTEFTLLDGSKKKIDPTPRYSDSLADAIKRILSVVPGWREGDDTAAQLREDEAVNVSLASLVGDRQRNGPVGLPTKCSAWDAIEIVCGLAARTVKVIGREIVVRTPEETFANNSRVGYEFIYGTPECNAFGPKLHKKFVTKRNGVRVVAWDPTNRKRLEALYPSDDELAKIQPEMVAPLSVGQGGASRRQRAPSPPVRDIFNVGAGVTTQSALDAVAKAVWTESSHGEVDGSVSSPIWDDKILALRNGDRIKLSIRPDIESQLRGLSNNEERSRYLQDALGVDESAAYALIRIALKPRDGLYYVRKVSYDWPSNQAVTVEFSTLLRGRGQE